MQRPLVCAMLFVGASAVGCASAVPVGVPGGAPQPHVRPGLEPAAWSSPEADRAVAADTATPRDSQFVAADTATPRDWQRVAPDSAPRRSRYQLTPEDSALFAALRAEWRRRCPSGWVLVVQNRHTAPVRVVEVSPTRGWVLAVAGYGETVVPLGHEAGEYEAVSADGSVEVGSTALLGNHPRSHVDFSLVCRGG